MFFERISQSRNDKTKRGNEVESEEEEEEVEDEFIRLGRTAGNPR